MTNLTRCHGTMTESQWLAWVRSALRSRWLRWKPRSEALIAARRKYKGSNKAQKWEYQCAICTDWYVAKQVEVDHYPRDAGSILSVEGIGNFCNNLFCEVDNLRVLCKPCHSVYTLSQRKGVSFEEAKIEKKINEWLKRDKQEVLAFCMENGYTEEMLSNVNKRREALSEILRRK